MVKEEASKVKVARGNVCKQQLSFFQITGTLSTLHTNIPSSGGYDRHVASAGSVGHQGDAPCCTGRGLRPFGCPLSHTV